MTPMLMTKRQTISPLEGILISMQMASTATNTGTVARITCHVRIRFAAMLPSLWQCSMATAAAKAGSKTAVPQQTMNDLLLL